MGFVHLTLLPIAEDATAALLVNALGPAVATPEVASRVHARCGGNPAFVLALLEQLPSAAAAPPAALPTAASPIAVSAASPAASPVAAAAARPSPAAAAAAHAPLGSEAEGSASSLLESLQKLPRRWEDIVLAHLDRLPMPQQTLVKAASVLGMQLELAALRGIWPGAMSAGRADRTQCPARTAPEPRARRAHR